MNGRVLSHTNTLLWREYYELCKPRVVLLIVFTAIVGMFLATPTMVPLDVLVFGTIGIGLAAASGAALNHLVDRRIDAVMDRTRRRPLPTGRLDGRSAAIFAVVLSVISVLLLSLLVNTLTALLSFASMVGYSVVYTLYLKRATPQNIVIGGAAGAFPPMVGWVAATGTVSLESVVLFAIIFFWTPPHFWALALYRCRDYERVGVPMLPVVAGADETRKQIWIYSLILAPLGVLPVALGFAGVIYGAVSIVAGGIFLRDAWRVYTIREGREGDAMAQRLFKFSILYLFVLFAVLLAENLVGAELLGSVGLWL